MFNMRTDLYQDHRASVVQGTPSVQLNSHRASVVQGTPSVQFRLPIAPLVFWAFLWLSSSRLGLTSELVSKNGIQAFPENLHTSSRFGCYWAEPCSIPFQSFLPIPYFLVD